MLVYALDAIRLLLGLSLAAYGAYTLIAIWAARRWHQSRPTLDPDWTPSVTILKPVRGVDAEAEANFASFCQLDYPPERVQIVFGALSSEDPALTLARRMQSDYPDCDIAVIAAGPDAVRGHNLKVCNLLAMLPAAKHDLLVLCDSDMRVQPDYLRRIVAPFKPRAHETGKPGDRAAEKPTNKLKSPSSTPLVRSASHLRSSLRSAGASAARYAALSADQEDADVGLVTCPYRGCRPQSFAAILEALGIGTEFIPSAFVSRALEGVSFAFGSTIALPRKVLAELGGFEALLDDLADDFRLGDGARRAGYTVVLSDYVVDDVLGRERFGPMWARRLRWARTVRSCRPAGYAGACITHGTALGLLFLLAMGGSVPGQLAFACVIACRCTSAQVIGLYIRDANIGRFWPLLPLSDLFSFGLYIASFCGNQIIWRGERFRLMPGGKMVRLSPHQRPQH